MTFKAGDKGQRYEVRCINSVGQVITVGWAETEKEINTLKKGIELHPSHHSPQIIDRKSSKAKEKK